MKDDVPPEGKWFFQGHRRWLKPDPLFERVSKRTIEYLDIADARVKRKAPMGWPLQMGSCQN